MLRLCLMVCVFAGVAFAATPSGDLEYHWGLFKDTYQKEYHPKEELQRRLIWEENVKIIREHNLLADMGIKTYRLGLNKYADLSSKEFREQVLGFNRLGAQPGAPNCSRTYMPPRPTDLPSSVDWRGKGYVTPVKDQKQCGSCWAFSATGSLEGQHFKKTGKLVSLSEQNLVDCAQKQGNHGCGGGFMQAAFKYIAINGIDTEASYPYTAKDGKCKFNKANVGATATGCMDIALESEEDLESAVANVGPIAVAIDAGHSSFQLYKSGVYSELFCSQDRLDHGVLAVGYGSMDGMDYWLIKNSWGLSWGEKGYINMRRGEYNQCGISTSASFPTV